MRFEFDSKEILWAIGHGNFSKNSLGFGGIQSVQQWKIKTYMVDCAGAGRKRCERSQELVSGMNIKLEQDCLYAYGA
jgi:hypothetical protein